MMELIFFFLLGNLNACIFSLNKLAFVEIQSRHILKSGPCLPLLVVQINFKRSISPKVFVRVAYVEDIGAITRNRTGSAGNPSCKFHEI